MAPPASSTTAPEAESAGGATAAIIDGPSRQRAIDDALNELLASCMAEAGFDYEVPPGPPASPSAVVDERLVPITEAEATRDGFSNPRAAGEPSIPQVALPDGEAAQQAFLAALNGPEASWTSFEVPGLGGGAAISTFTNYGGCSRVADEGLFGSLDAKAAYYVSIRQIAELFGDVESRAAAAPTYLAALAAWSQCLVAAGGPAVAAPLDLLAHPWPEPRPSAVEVAAAIGHVRCSASSGLGAAWRAALDRAGAEVMQPHADLVANHDAAWAAVSARLPGG